MSLNWGPHFIVPSENLREFSGVVRLRERLNEDLLRKELDALQLSGSVIEINNPWYFRKKGEETWIFIGESTNRAEDFPVKWDTTAVQNGDYEILGLMHVTVRGKETERIIARQNIRDVAISN